MSKIQKALEALRSGEAESKPKQPSPHSRQRANPVPTVQAAPDAAQQAAAPAPNVLTPGRTINVDFDKLIANGLLPSGFDKDVISDQFRRIKRPILQSAFEIGLPVGDNANVIMMASAMPGAGKSFCAFNMAHSISFERDSGAVLIDADVLKPSISRALDMQEETGLIDYLLDPTMDLADILFATDLQDIMVIPAGHRHPEATELLASRRMEELVSELSAAFADRAVVVDAPPLLLTNEAQVLAQQVGQIVLVIEARVSSQEQVLRALGMLDQNKPINAILNKSRSASVSGYHSDDYGYYPYPRGDHGNAKGTS